MILDDVEVLRVRDTGWPECQLIVLVKRNGDSREFRVAYEDTFMGNPLKFAPELDTDPE